MQCNSSPLPVRGTEDIVLKLVSALTQQTKNVINQNKGVVGGWYTLYNYYSAVSRSSVSVIYNKFD